jgi:hypothetical protein
VGEEGWRWKHRWCQAVRCWAETAGAGSLMDVASRVGMRVVQEARKVLRAWMAWGHLWCCRLPTLGTGTQYCSDGAPWQAHRAEK